ncbi:C39 family peptidase [Caproiciproducens sp. NJN-50]|uniref:C39 family peptidase n=1 Tax=Caproiciproducens sp. NJN-50 TaxID=2507162 RepID=UPI0013E8E894|nr:C39 family peptidase [Caproiciproducens sp. NJN-50]
MKEHHQRGHGRKKWPRFIILAFALAAGCTSYFTFCRIHTKTANVPREKSAAVTASKPASASESQKPANPGRTLISVPHLSQEGVLPTGCELVSAMMLLNYYGCSTTADEIIKRTPKSSLLSDGNAVYGMSPNQAFIGDPRSGDGLGCYAPVLTAVVDSYFWEGGKKEAANLTGTDLDALARDYIAKGSPVLIWATVDMGEPGIGKSWTLADTGGNFQWIAGEHCLLMVGFDSEKYYFNDPLDSGGAVSYRKSLVEDRYRALGKQAVTVRSVSRTST